MQLTHLYRMNILAIHGHDQRMSKVDLHLQGLQTEIKDLCLQLKRSVSEYAAQKITFSTSTVGNGRPLPL